LQVFGDVMAAQRAKVPDSIDAIIAAAPDARTREILITSFYGSAMDVIRKFLPDPNRHRCIGGSLAAMTIDGTHLGPYSPGTACSMAYHYTVSGGANLFKMPKGGIGTMSEAILKSFEEHGGTVQYRADVQRLLVEKGRVVGVQLRNGETISSKVVLSSADARSTFLKLVGEEQLPTEFVQAVKEIEYTNGYIQLHLTLKELPEFTGHLAFANENNIRWLTSYIPSPEHLSRCWEQYRRNQVPDDPVSYCYIPSVMDPSLAPAGYYTCTMFSHYFPAELAPAQHRQLLAGRRGGGHEQARQRLAEQRPLLLGEGAVADQRLGVEPSGPVEPHGDPGQVAPEGGAGPGVEREPVDGITGRVEAGLQVAPGRPQRRLDVVGPAALVAPGLGVQRQAVLVERPGQRGGRLDAPVVAEPGLAGQARQLEDQGEVAALLLQEGRLGRVVAPVEPVVAQRAGHQHARAGGEVLAGGGRHQAGREPGRLRRGVEALQLLLEEVDQPVLGGEVNGHGGR
jgi:hypothetical protein